MRINLRILSAFRTTHNGAFAQPTQLIFCSLYFSDIVLRIADIKIGPKHIKRSIIKHEKKIYFTEIDFVPKIAMISTKKFFFYSVKLFIIIFSHFNKRYTGH